MKKQIVTMRIGDYEPEICRLTMPTIEHFAKKSGCEYKVITEPVFNAPSVTYEKFQLYQISKGYDWTMFLDADTLVHPDCPDWTEMISKDTVLFNGVDLNLNRFRANDWTRRSNNKNGACTWHVWFSDWCRDIWHPMMDMTWDECMDNIFPTVNELASGTCSKQHLIDDYLVTQNISRFGLKVTTVGDLLRQIGRGQDGYYFHLYACSSEHKLNEIKRVLGTWGIKIEGT